MIAIIAAMAEEVNAITALLEQKKEMKVSGIAMVKGQIGKQKVIVMKSGVGKGNAVMATTILLENFVVDHIINIGTAGGLKREQQILDAVISTQVVQHDFDTSSIDGEDGIGLYFEADQDLAHRCRRVMEELEIPVHMGLVASGDQFIAEEEQLALLEERFPEAICAEMEAGAIAQVCSHYGIPFVVLRSLSDIAHQEGSSMDFTTYVQHAADRSAAFCKAFVESMKQKEA